MILVYLEFSFVQVIRKMSKGQMSKRNETLPTETALRFNSGIEAPLETEGHSVDSANRKMPSYRQRRKKQMSGGQLHDFTCRHRIQDIMSTSRALCGKHFTAATKLISQEVAKRQIPLYHGIANKRRCWSTLDGNLSL